jgi:hypothetical protein
MRGSLAFVDNPCRRALDQQNLRSPAETIDGRRGIQLIDFCVVRLKTTEKIRAMYGESRKHPARRLTVSVGNLSVILHITACTFRRHRILACDEIHNLIVSAWRSAPEWTVGRYVVMPDHVHLVAAENEFHGCALGQWVARWKAHVSRLWPFLKDQPI